MEAAPELLEAKIDTIARQLQTLESRINSDMRNILELLHQVAGPGLRGQAEPEAARVQVRLHQREVSPDPTRTSDPGTESRLSSGHSRPPKLARRLFPSSDSSSPYDEDTGPGGGGGWRSTHREDSRGSEAGTAESWEFKSVQETPERRDTAAPIARLESLDELETSQGEEGSPVPTTQVKRSS